MTKLGSYWKSIVAAAGTGALIVQAAVTDTGISDNEWVKIAIAALTAIGVYGIRNKPYVNTDDTMGRHAAL